MQLQRYCGYHKNLTLEKKRDLILLCKHLYREGLKLGRGFPETEPKPGDFFAILGVHILMEIYVESSEEGRIAYPYTCTCAVLLCLVVYLTLLASFFLLISH